MLEVLLELGADPDRHLTSYYCGDALPIIRTDPTPLMLLTSCGIDVSANELKAAKMLLEAGADPHVNLTSGSAREDGLGHTYRGEDFPLSPFMKAAEMLMLSNVQFFFLFSAVVLTAIR